MRRVKKRPGTMISKKRHTLLLSLSETVPHTDIINSLRTSDYHLLESQTSEYILQKLNEHPDIDLILMTLDVPGMNGIETILAIRKKDIKIPIILFLHHVTIDSVRLALQLGCTEVLQSPVSKESLDAVILKYLKN